MPNSNLPPFRLYGLIGCPHCDRAQEFMQSRHLPTIYHLGNEDPIIIEGIKKVTNQGSFPVLYCSITNEAVVGFKINEYTRLAQLYHNLAASGALANTGTPNLLNSQQQSEPEVSTPAPEVPTGTVTVSGV